MADIAEPRPAPIFNLSFNKCGTTTLHRFLQGNGLKSRSHGGNNTARNLACTFFRNFSAQRDPLTGIRQFAAFHDLNFVQPDCILEANALFRYFHEYHPGAWFIFVHRDVDDWIRSRFRHGQGDFAERYKTYYGLESDTEVEDLWRAQYENGAARIREYFAGHPERFLHFDLKRDDPQKVVDFLAPEYELDVSLWSIENAKPPLPDAGTPRA